MPIDILYKYKDGFILRDKIGMCHNTEMCFTAEILLTY